MQLVSGNYTSRKELQKALKEDAASKGFRLVVSDSSLIKNTFSLKCDRYGEYRGQPGVKKTGSKKTNCKFAVNCSYNKSGSWVHNVTSSVHSHGLGDIGPEAINADQKQIVAEMQSIGETPRLILTKLQHDLEEEVKKKKLEHPDSVSIERIIVPPTAKQLYNVMSDVRKQLLNNNLPIEALILKLLDDGTTHSFSRDTLGMATGVFFAFPESVKLAHVYHHVIVLDCTYKTNRYAMPLLHIVGQVFAMFSSSLL
jgi:hypothetical protein